MKEDFGLKGIFRLQIGEETDGKVMVVGDSKWIENQIVNLGWQDYILGLIGAVAGSKQIGRMILGTGTAPASDATVLPGETVRSSDINAVTSGSFTLQLTTVFASGDHPGGTPVMQNAALINDTASDGTILAGQTYATSQWQSNQGISATYNLQKA